MKIVTKIVAILWIATFFCCTTNHTSKAIYKTASLVIEQISPTVFKHVSYLQTDDFGNVACNGMIYITNNEALVFDTPTTDKVSKEVKKLTFILRIIRNKISVKIKMVLMFNLLKLDRIIIIIPIY